MKKIINQKTKDFIIRPLLEKIGISKYSRPSLNNIDKKLENYLDYNNGIFLEVGANNGLKQSNTYYYEKIRNWKGILIEPIPKLFDYCKKIRKNSEVFNFICTSPKQSGTKRSIKYADLMSQVDGALKNNKKEKEHFSKWMDGNNRVKTYNIECRTLNEIIEKSKFNKFDFMSVDVEGYEFEVLKGLDLEKYKPDFLLVEVWSHEKEDILNLLNKKYKIQEYLTNKDILFKKV